jgi:hypothetical protein
VQSRSPGELGGAEGAVTGDQFQAVQIDVLQFQARNDPVIEQGQLVA